MAPYNGARLRFYRESSPFSSPSTRVEACVHTLLGAFSTSHILHEEQSLSWGLELAKSTLVVGHRGRRLGVAVFRRASWSVPGGPFQRYRHFYNNQLEIRVPPFFCNVEKLDIQS